MAYACIIKVLYDEIVFLKGSDYYILFYSKELLYLC